MRHLRKLPFLLTLLILLPAASFAQDCLGYHELGDCNMDRERGFKIYSQSKSVSLSALDTIDLNIVFYGQKDYIFSFCTHAKFYPIHFQLVDPETEDVLYDNEDDRYIESIGIGFNTTKSLTIRLNVLARAATDAEIENYLSCLGLLIQYRNYPERNVNVQM